MTDNDTKLLSEAYSRVLGEKALTPEQIAKKAKPAGKGGGGLPKNKKEDKETLETLAAKPYTDQDPENFDQDGENKTVKDEYTLKEAVVPGSFESYFERLTPEQAKEVLRLLYTNSNPQFRATIQKYINDQLTAQQNPATSAPAATPAPGPTAAV